MDHGLSSIGTRLEGRKGLLLLAGLGIATITSIGVARAIALSGPMVHVAIPHITTQPTGGSQTARAALPSGVQLIGTLSQTKLVQGERGELYLSVSVTTPDIKSAIVRQASDTVVILDHSGSMSADNRLPYAKRAIHDLVDRMDANDRFALVVFDSSAQILSPLVDLNSDSKSRIHALVDQIRPGSGTNMSSGIELARSLVSGRNSDRAHKVILLSDGEANEGITDPRQLDQMVSAVNKESATVSTIGMGLGFNEQLMASLADWGGGTFGYLEHLDKLSEILNRNLEDARQMFASSSTLEFTVPTNVTVVDAAGYPVERNGSLVTIPTGQLLSGSAKQLTLTLNVPTSSTGDIDLGTIAFKYGNGSDTQRLELPKTVMQLAIVEPARRSEAFASVNEQVYKDSWNMNNLGVLKRKIRDYVARGDVSAAKSEMAVFNDKLEVAQKSINAPLVSGELKEEMRRISIDLDEADKGSAYEKADKQNRLGKKYLADGRAAQRSSK